MMRRQTLMRKYDAPQSLMAARHLGFPRNVFINYASA